MAKHYTIVPSNENGNMMANCEIHEYKCGRKDLYSYRTLVCSILEGGMFIRRWLGYSATTMKHINAFRKWYGLEPIHKKEWDAMKYM